MSTELDEKVEAIHTLGVLGAGQMGGGISQVAAASGFDVRMADASLELAEQGKAKIAKGLERLVQKDKMSADMARASKASRAAASSP